MAHSNYKVLTDVDLSNNQLLNVSRIENTEEASKSLYIKTNGNTTLEVANLTGNVATGTTSLTTKNSEVTVTGTATETITTSKTTTVATNTKETIDSTGISIQTPSQTVVATASSKVESPSVTLVTGTPEGTGNNKQAKITLTKTANTDNSAIATSAKTVTVDADVIGGSITQTAPTSIYKTSEDNKIVLDNTGITLTNNSEVAKLGNGMTSVAGTELNVTTTTVNINHTGTNTISANDIHLHTKGNNPASSLDISSGETTLKSPKVVLNGTGSEGVTVKSGDTSSSVAVKSTTVKIDSKGTLDVSANGNISVDNPGFTIDIDTKDVLEKATVSSTVRSPKITLVTGTPEGTGNNKQAKIALTKTANTDDSKIDASAKTVEVTATGSITQTAPTSTYQTTDKDRKIILDSADITLKNRSEIVKLKNNQTEISGTKLFVDAGAVSVDNSTTDIVSTDGITAKTDAGSELEILTTGATLESPKVTFNGTGDGVEAKSGNSSVNIKKTAVNVNSDGTLTISADEGIEINDDTSVSTIAQAIYETATNGTISNTAGTITLATNKSSGDNAGTSTLTIDGSKSTLNTDSSTVTATTITQTAPTSTYEADGNNKLELGTGSAKITSGTETITLAKAKDGAAAKTTISSNDLVASATKVTVENNTTTSVTSSKSVTVTAISGADTSTVTTKPVEIGLESKKVSLTASVTESENKKSSRITLSPAASAEEGALSLSTDKNLKINSVSGATIEDNNSIALTAPIIKETASDSANIYSGKINLQNTETNSTEKIVLDNNTHNIAATAGSASVSITGNTANTVVVNGAEFKVSSNKSTFDNNSTFSKNVNIVGDLTTRDMTGEAAKLDSLDVKATTTVGGNLTTSGNVQLASINGVDATLESLLTVDGTTDVHGNATVGELKVADGKTLTANNGATSTGAVSVKGTTTVNSTATVGLLKVADGKTLTANNGMTSTGAVSVGGTTGVTANANVGALVVSTGKTLTAKNGMTSTGDISVGGTTSVSGNASTGTLTVANGKTLTANNGLTSTGLVSVTGTTGVSKNASTGTLTIPDNQTLTANSGMNATGLVTVTGTTTTGTLVVADSSTLKANGDLTSSGAISVAGTTTVNKTATTGTLAVTGELTARSGLISTGAVSVGSTTSVSDTTATDTLAVTGGLIAKNGLTSTGAVSVGNTTTVSGTAKTGTLEVPNKTLTANDGLTSTGAISVGSTTTVTGTAGVGALSIPSGKTLTANNGMTSTGAVSVDGTTQVTNNANIGNLSVPSGKTLTASNGMTSTGAVTVSGTTDVSTLTGAGTLSIPTGKTLTATNGGSSGSVAVTSTTINTVTGLGSLTIPSGKSLSVTNGGTSSSIAVTSTTINTIDGGGSLVIPENKELTINNGGTSGTSTTGTFKPTNITVNTVSGNGSLVIPDEKTLTVSNGGTVNGSMVIGKAGSTATNLTLNGNATIGTNGVSGTTLLSYAEIDARSTLAVAEKATFSKNAEVAGDFILDGVTIKWDSTLGALTFSKG